jgi:hypothetical protein
MTNGSMDPLVSPAATSTSSVSSVVFPSPRYPTPQSSVGTSTPSIARATGVGRPLSPADVKAVFLNLAQLAVLSDELATGFERALGQLDSEIGSPVETGADCLGEMFCETVRTF